jgi:cellulose synthase/poly-beta-1,6-N-acetylglucosamine synthase-like glycosyltransferase
MITFIVPAHNEEQLLGRTLAALHAASAETGVSYELLVVDDASTDRTSEVARAAGARVIAVHHRQIARTRNAGARAAAGDLLIFVDADTLVNARTLRATVAAIESGAVGGGALLSFDEPLPVAAHVLVATLALVMRLWRLAPGAYLFCTRQAFDAVGGFDETLFATEELTMSRALRRAGPTVILRERVLTSGRKARTHDLFELLAPLGLLLRYGPSARRHRRRLSLWYGRRRDDPRRP